MTIRHRIVKLAAALLVLLGLTFGPAGVAPASAARTCYYISARHSGHFLDVEGGSTAADARIIQWYTSYTSNQRFIFVHHAGQPADVYTIEAYASGLVLDLRAYNAGGQVIQAPYQDGRMSQQWESIPIGGGVYKYRNMATGLFLDVSGYSYSAGAPLVQWYGSGGLNQQFGLLGASCP